MLERIPLIYYALSGLFNFVMLSTLAIFAFLKNPKLSVNRIFSVFTLTAAGWGLFHFLWLSTINNPFRADLFLRTVMLFVVFMPATFTHFILTFLKIDRDKKINIGNYLITFIIGATVYTPLYARDMGPFLVFPFWLKPGPFFHLHLLHFIGNVIYSHFLMLQVIRHHTGILRNQIFYVFIGTAIGYTAGVFNYFPWYRIPIPPFLNPLVSVYVAFVTIAIIKYRLMDIKVAVTRAGIFVLVYLFVLGIPFVLGYKYSQWHLATWVTVILATAGPFIYLYLQRRAEKILRKEQLEYQEKLRQTSSTIMLTKDLDKLLRAIVLNVVDIVRVSWAWIYLKDEKEQKYTLRHKRARMQDIDLPCEFSSDSDLVKHLYKERLPIIGEEVRSSSELKIGLAVPCFIEDNLLGFLLLGDKPKAQLYDESDVNVFTLLSNQTALAIENCQFYSQERQREHLRRIATLDRQIDCMAHEIDNPIQALLGIIYSIEMNIDELKERIPQDKLDYLKNKLERANFNAHRISKMIEAVKEFSKPTTGELSLVSLAELLEDFSYIISPQFKHSGIDFIQELPDQHLWLRANKVELTQVLVNLATNSLWAINQAPQANKREVKLKVYSRDDLTLRMDFADTGCGIEKKLLEDIFLDFVTTKASSVGTGLGLSISRKIITRHKGRIWAESEGVDKGAVFHIELPIAKDITEEELRKVEQEKREREKRIMF